MNITNLFDLSISDLCGSTISTTRGATVNWCKNEIIFFSILNKEKNIYNEGHALHSLKTQSLDGGMVH